jgi:hypothetical protein
MTTKPHESFRLFFLWAVLILLVTGCAYIKGRQASEPEPVAVQTESGIQETDLTPADAKPEQTAHIAPFVHTVRWPGESLSHISKWYTGKYANWKMIAKANPGLNPNRIRKGEKIVIPQALLKTEKSLPKDFIAKATPEPKQTKVDTKTEAPTTVENALPLFGPKE